MFLTHPLFLFQAKPSNDSDGDAIHILITHKLDEKAPS